MRKFIVFMVLNICSFCAYATNDKTEVREDIRIKELYQSEGVVDRGIFTPVSAALIKTGNVIEVCYSGLSNPSIYIIDSFGLVVSQIRPCSGSSVEHIPTPPDAGVFTLVIIAEAYYGHGIFTIV